MTNENENQNQKTNTFADDLRGMAEDARNHIEKEKKIALDKEIQPVRDRCALAAAEGKNEIQLKQGEISEEGVLALKRLGLRVANFNTQYASITVAWDK